VTAPPPLIPFTGDWATYEERIYQAFLESFVKRQVLFHGIPVKAQFRPPFKGKGFSFWHVISEALNPRRRKEEERIPDLRRCERILWISWAIECASSGQPGFSWWENRRKGETRVVIWAEEHDYAVVLAKRKGYYVLKTAFYGIKPHRRRQFEAERKAFWGT